MLHTASIGAMDGAAEVIPRKRWKFANKRKCPFSPTSRLDFGECTWPKGNRAQLWEVITCWALAHAGWVSWQSWMRARVGPCAKIPSAECSVMSERLPIGWKDVGKQEQIYIYISRSVQPARVLRLAARLGWQPLTRLAPEQRGICGTERGRCLPLLVRRTLLKHFLLTGPGSVVRANCLLEWWVKV